MTVCLQPFQLMRLKVDITEHFKTGDIVSLSDQLMPAYRSPTKVSLFTRTCLAVLTIG